tara:strand:- start:290 stop:937 length:648 start_codon:yes stop_codon:yes gene_type:complete
MIKASVNLMESTINYVDITDPNTPTPKLFESLMPSSNDTLGSETDEEMKAKHPIASKISTRNFRDTYIVPTEMEQIYINLVPTKNFVTDSDLNYVLDTDFEYFIEPAPTVAELPQFTLVDGTIYRITGNGFKDVKDYSYYVIVDDEVQTIPNYKTVEVMLAERGQIVDAIRVVTPGQHQDLLMNSDTIALVKGGMDLAEAELLVSNGGGALSGGS